MCTWSVASGLGMGARLTGVLFDLLFFFFFFFFSLQVQTACLTSTFDGLCCCTSSQAVLNSRYNRCHSCKPQ